MMQIAPGRDKVYTITWWPESLSANDISLMNQPEQYIIIDPETGETGYIRDPEQKARLTSDIASYQEELGRGDKGNPPKLSDYRVTKFPWWTQALNSARVAVQSFLGEDAATVQQLASIIGNEGLAKIALKVMHGQSVTFGDVAWAVVETAFGAVGGKAAKGATKAIAAAAKKLGGPIREKFFKNFIKIIKDDRALTSYVKDVRHWKRLEGMSDAAVKKMLREASEHVGKNMPYSMAKKLTDGFKGLIQAHHIFPTELLEKVFPEHAAKLARGVWAVVLDAAGHKRITESFAKAISKYARELQAAGGNPAKLKEVVKKILEEAYEGEKELLEMAETILENLPWDCLG